MKAKFFTSLIAAIFCGMIIPSVQAQDTSTGITWGTNAPSEPLVLNENFRGFTHFHSRANTNDSNSRNVVDGEGNVTEWGYKNNTVEVPILGSSTGKITYEFYQCAFGPNWLTAYAYRDSLASGTGENTPNVSRGFTEISRLYTSHNTVDGHFILDLRQLDFVEVLQYSHSSCGGTRRGLLLEFSLDNGTTWDTLRYQPGDAWASSFTKDVNTLEKTANTFNCTPSAYGMTWEEGIYGENVMLRFGIAKNQALRIHDLKVYGTYTGATLSKEPKTEELKVFSAHKKIRISETADVAVYNLTGALVVAAENTNLLPMDIYPDGIYLVKVKTNNRTKTVKVLVK